MPREEQGISSDRYSIIPRTLIFVRCGESYLLIKGAADKKLWANKYNGVGGHVENHEDIHTAACRELAEETGLSVELSLCGIVTVDVEEKKGIGIFVFTGIHFHGIVSSSPEGSLEWVPIKDLDSYPLVADVKSYLDRISMMKKGDAPFFAHSYYDAQGKWIINFND
jgi:8-oxo-dGTP diphosphatase